MDEETEVQSEMTKWRVKGMQLLNAKTGAQTQTCLPRLAWAPSSQQGHRNADTGDTEMITPGLRELSKKSERALLSQRQHLCGNEGPTPATKAVLWLGHWAHERFYKGPQPSKGSNPSWIRPSFMLDGKRISRAISPMNTSPEHFILPSLGFPLSPQLDWEPLSGSASRMPPCHS